MKIIETGPREIGFVLWGHCQNLLDDPRIKKSSVLLFQIRPNKKISVFRVTGLKILGRVGTHIFFLENIHNFMHFERHFTFQNA